MQIELLAENTEVIPALADSYLLEWEPYYGMDGPGDARTDLESRCNHDALPIGLVAMEGNHVLGTAALDLDVATDLTPSVVGLLVEREHRGRGIATKLLESTEGLAKRLGYSRIYISTTVLGDLLVHMGWHPIGRAEFLNDEQGSIYTRNLKESHQ